MFKKLILASVAALISTTAANAKIAKYDTWGDWLIQGDTVSRSCAATRDYPNGTKLTFVIEGRKLLVGIKNASVVVANSRNVRLTVGNDKRMTVINGSFVAGMFIAADDHEHGLANFFAESNLFSASGYGIMPMDGWIDAIKITARCTYDLSGEPA